MLEEVRKDQMLWMLSEKGTLTGEAMKQAGWEGGSVSTREMSRG